MALPSSGQLSMGAIADNNSSASRANISLQTESIRFASASIVGDVDGSGTGNQTADRTTLRQAPHALSEFRGANFPSSIITDITFATEGSDTNTVDGEDLGVTFFTNGQAGTYTVRLIDSSDNTDASTTRSGAGTVTFSNLNLTEDTYRPQVEFDTFNVVNDDATFTHHDQVSGENTGLSYTSANVDAADESVSNVVVTPSVSTGTQESSSVSSSIVTKGDGGDISATISSISSQAHTMVIANTPGVLKFTSFHIGDPSAARNNATSSRDLTISYNTAIDGIAVDDTTVNSGQEFTISAVSEGVQSKTLRLGYGTSNSDTTYTANSDKSISDTRFVRSAQSQAFTVNLTSGTSLVQYFPKAHYTDDTGTLVAGTAFNVAPAYSYSTPGDATINVNTTRALDVSSVVGNNSSVAITSSPDKGSGTNTATFSPGTLNDVYTITYQGTANYGQTNNQTDTITVNPTVSVARSSATGNPTTDADGVSISSTSHGISPTTFTFTPTAVGTSLGFTYSMASGFSFTGGTNANTAGAIQGTFNSAGSKSNSLQVASNGTSATDGFSVTLDSITKNFDSATTEAANAGGFRAGSTVDVTLQVDYVKRAKLQRQLADSSYEDITGTTTISHGGGLNQSGDTIFTINSGVTVDGTQRNVRIVDVDRTANTINLSNEDSSSSTFTMLAKLAVVNSFVVTPSATVLRSIFIDWATTDASTVTLKRADNSGMNVNVQTLVNASSDVDGDFTDTSVVNGITYYYQLTATNASGENTTSSVVSGASISPSISFGSFSNATFSKGATGNITFTITPNFSSPEVDVKMVRTSTSGVFETDSNVGITKNSATTITFSQANATTEAARYEAEVYETGTSTLLAQSGNQITVNTAPVSAAPSSVSISDNGSGRVLFNFTDNANNETRFRAQAINNNNSQQEGSDLLITTTNSAGTGVSYTNDGTIVTNNNNFYFGRIRAERVVTNDFTSQTESAYVNSSVIEVGTAPESIGTITLDQSSYVTGEDFTISYSTGNLDVDETITIKLMSGTTTHTTFTTLQAGNTTSFGGTFSTSLSTASNYFIRIHKTGDTGVSNDSSNFTINATSIGVSSPSDVSETTSGTYTRDHTFTISNPNPDGVTATLTVGNVGLGNGIGNATSGEGFSYAHSTSGFGSLSSQTTGTTNFSSFTGTNIYVRSRFIYSESDSFDGRIDTSLSYNGKSASDNFDYNLGECFDLDTLILMSDNTTKKLRDIETGDVVKTWSIPDMPNTDDKNIYMNWSTDTISGSSEVTASVVATNLGHSHSNYWYINSGSSSEFKVSDSHGIFVKDSSDNYKFKYASNLTTDDKLFDVNLNEVDIVNIEQMSGSIDTGWIDVESVDVNYYAGILAHNKCFVEGTLVTLWDGSQKPIEQIEVDDVIMSYDVVTNSVVSDVITNVVNPIHDDIIDIKFDNDTINSNTFDHPYYVLDKGWSSYKPKLTKLRYGIDTEQIKVGDVCLYGKNLEEVKIESITENIGERQTYTLEGTTGVNTFFANGIVVHNESK